MLQSKKEILNNNIQILKEFFEGDFTNSKQFTGFGGMLEYMQDANVEKKLKSFFNDEQLNLLIKSTDISYYTPKEIVDFCWEIAEKLGFDGGSILEPACGTGVFFEHMPEHIRKNSNITGIEVEDLSYNIAKANHQDIKFFNKTYQDYNEKGHDLIIGMPAIKYYTVQDNYNTDLNDMALCNAFLVRSIRLLREGGICIIILPKSTLDASINRNVREKVSNISELVFSCRLPKNTFLNAEEAVRDIAVFQRKNNPKKYELNNYYIDNPNNILSKTNNLNNLIKKLKPCYNSFVTSSEYNKKIFHGTAEAFKNFKGEVVWFAYEKAVAEAFANSSAGLRAIKKGTIKLLYGDSKNILNTGFIKNILIKNNLRATKGRVITRSLSEGKVLNLTNDIPYKVSDISELKKVWKNLQSLGLISKAWEDINDKEKENLKIKYFYSSHLQVDQELSMWYFLESENIYSKALSAGFDYIKINDIDVDGNDIISLGVLNLDKINNKKFI